MASTSRNPEPTSIKWGIVGLGDVTQTKSGPPFWKCHGSQLVAVMRRTPGKAAEFAQRVQNKNQEECVGYDDFDMFLNHPGLQAVYVSTRPGTHLELVRKIANRKNLAVYVEKPVGRCAEETREMIHVCQESGLPFYTAYISRAYERTQAVRQLLRKGFIGDSVTNVDYKLVGTGGARGMEESEVPWRLDASQSGGGLLLDVGCHVLDRIDYICGPLVQVKGRAQQLHPMKRIKVEDYVEMTAKIGTSNWSAIPSEDAIVKCIWDFSNTSDQEPVDELVITGPKGKLKMAAMSPSLPVYVLDVNDKITKTLEFGSPEHTAQNMIQAVTDELRGVASEEEKQHISRGENALRTSMVIDEMLRGYYGTREIGYWTK